MFLMMESSSYLQKDRKVNHEMSGDVRFYLFGDDYKSVVYYILCHVQEISIFQYFSYEDGSSQCGGYILD